MAKFKATWLTFDGEVFDSEYDATVHEAKLYNLGLKGYLKELGINLTAKQIDVFIKERKHLIKLLNKHETGNKSKGKKSPKIKD